MLTHSGFDSNNQVFYIVNILLSQLYVQHTLQINKKYNYEQTDNI